jgi:pyrroloquinoline quinone biosynthesis protein E
MDGLQSKEKNPLSGIAPPYALLAELTHSCPLHCLYCSNPINLVKKEKELSTSHWLNIIEQASDLGIMQMHFSGGEPLIRTDLEQLINKTRDLNIYSNLITSGIGLTQNRLSNLITSGINHIQLSIQSHEAVSTKVITNSECFQAKQSIASLIKESQLPFTINIVLHALNLDNIEEIIEMCISWGAHRIELANTQYYGFALANQSVLLPNKLQIEKAFAIYQRKKQEYGNKIEIIWVIPDYFEEYPKPCMGGWGLIQLTITPAGQVLPCPAASIISSISFENVREKSLDWIWYESSSFNIFRGDMWMKEPCKSCIYRFDDYGGCRCQAFAITGSASNTDPVCKYSPYRPLIDNAISTTNSRENILANIKYRNLD